MSKYLILPSNASACDFPTNTANSFEVKLPERLSYERGQWEIAMHSLTYSNNWMNVRDARVDIYYKEEKKTTVKFPDGRYASVFETVFELYKALASHGQSQRVAVELSAKHSRPFIRIIHPDYGVALPPDLADILGFVPGKIYKKVGESGTILAPNEPHLDTVYENLYVYCNLCENRLVGDRMVPCLYNAPVKWSGKPSSLVHEIVEEPMYVPVASVNTDVIEIDIRRRDGEPVLFKGGNVIVTVHLQKISR